MRIQITIFTIMLLCIASSELLAQKYGTSAGVRFGNERYGLNVRQRLLPRLTTEFMVEFEPDAYQFTFLPKYHLPLIGAGFNFYVGMGAHLGGLKDYGLTYGWDLITGLEWKIPAVPLTVSADIKPAYHMQHAEWFEFPAAISVNYVFAKETKEKRKKARVKRKKRKERREKRAERRAARQEWWQQLRGDGEQ